MSDMFVADVGGTNARLARVTEAGVTDIKKYICNDFASIDLVIFYRSALFVRNRPFKKQY